MDTAELLQKVRQIEIKTRGLSKQLFAGEYHSAFKGQGMSFSEVRSYQYGDDVRSIDWNVTARTNEPHIKIFEEERELNMLLMVDVSQSVYYGTGEESKRNYITELCAVLAFSALQNNDKVGLILFADEVELFIPPKKGKKHVLRIIRELVTYKPRTVGTRIDEALSYAHNVFKKRGICIMLSDWQQNNYQKPLRILSRRHDCIAMRIYDALEARMPSAGLVRMQDPETGTLQLVDTSNKKTQESIQEIFNNRSHYFEKTMATDRIDHITFNTTEGYIKPLLQFFKQR